MRKLLLLLCLLSVTACAAPDDDSGGVATVGGATPTPGASGAPAAGSGDGLAFARCMRENGLSWFQDPAPDEKGVRIDVPKGTDRATVDAAMEACRYLLPNGGRPPKADPESLEQMRKVSKCMRENGIPKFPDPDPEGGIRIDDRELGVGPGDPVFDKAQEACSHLMPEPPATNREGE